MPFARDVRGEVERVPDFEGPEPDRITLAGTMWFPTGRARGSTAWLALPAGWPGESSTIISGFVGDGGEVVFEVRGYVYEGNEVIGSVRLAAGSDDAQFAASQWNRGMWLGDVVEPWTAHGTLCSTGDAPPIVLTLLVGAPALSPSAAIVFLPSGPLDPDRVEVTVTADGMPVAVTPELRGNRLSIWADESFPPGASLAVDASLVRDVLGRVVILDDSPPVLSTTDSVTDLGFDTEPPPGSVAGTGEWVAGAFRVGVDGRDGVSALVSLGDVPGDVIAIYAAAECRGSLPLALVAGDGSTSEASLCDAEPPLRLDRPGPGPLWLSVWGRSTWLPQMSWPPPPTITIDAIAFE